jgi:hypothetical protein
LYFVTFYFLSFERAMGSVVVTPVPRPACLTDTLDGMVDSD